MARLNFALGLTGGTVADVKVAPFDLVEGMIGDNQEAALDRITAQLVAGGISAATRVPPCKSRDQHAADPARLKRCC